MKTAESKSSAAAAPQQKANHAPLFQPEGSRESFFGGEKATPAFFQPKLKVGAPDDFYEKQADSVADSVVGQLNAPATPNPATSPAGAAPASAIQAKCADCEQEDKLQKKDEEIGQTGEQLQRKPIFDSAAEPPDGGISGAAGTGIQRKPIFDSAARAEEGVQRKTEGNSDSHASDDVSSRLQSSKGGGSPLPSETRSQMEGAMGADFSGVRVHTGSEAAGLSNDLGAQAFTHGNDVYFNEGKYNPGTTDGQHLLAHELTHTVQQGAAQPSVQRVPTPAATATTPPPATTTPVASSPAASTAAAGPPQRPTTAIDITQRFDPDEHWRAYLEQTRNTVEVPVRIGNDYEGSITIRRNTRRDVANRAGGYDLMRGRRYLDAKGMPFLSPLTPILYLRDFGPEGQTTGFLSIRTGETAIGDVMGMISGINRNLEAMRFLGLAPLVVPNTGITNVFENGRLAFQVSQLSTVIGGYLRAGGGIGIVGGNFTFNLNADVTIPGIATGQFTLSRSETGELGGRANIEANVANVNATLLVEYQAGEVSIQGTGRIQSEKFQGSVTLLVTDSVRARQMMHAALGVETMDAAAEAPAHPPVAKTPQNQVLVGWGEVTATITPWLSGTAHIGIDAQGHVTLIGELSVTNEVQLMEQRLKRFDLFQTEIRAGYGIPLLGQVFLFARLKMFINAGLGPLVLRDIRFTGTYSTDPAIMQQFAITGTLAINAFAVLALAVEAGVGLTLLGHDLTAGINGTAAAGIRAYALATPTFQYTEHAAPQGGKVGESHLRGHFEAAAQLFLQLSGSLFYEIDSPWWSPVPDGREDYPLGEIQYPLGQSMGIGADVDWLVGSPDIPELTFTPVEFDASQFTADILADPPPGRQGENEANPAGDWQDGNAAGGGQQANPTAEGGAPGVPHGERHEENLHNLPDEQRYMRGLGEIADIAQATSRLSIAQVTARVNRVKGRYNLDQARIQDRNDDNVTVFVSHARQNNRDHLVQIPIVNAAEQERLSHEALQDLTTRMNQKAGTAGTISQADAQALSHEWQQAHPIVESIRVIDGHERWDYQVDFGEHGQTVHGKGKGEGARATAAGHGAESLTPEQQQRLNAGTQALHEKERQYSTGDAITLEGATHAANDTVHAHPDIFERITVIDGHEDWDYEVVQRTAIIDGKVKATQTGSSQQNATAQVQALYQALTGAKSNSIHELREKLQQQYQQQRAQGITAIEVHIPNPETLAAELVVTTSTGVQRLAVQWLDLFAGSNAETRSLFKKQHNETSAALSFNGRMLGQVQKSGNGGHAEENLLAAHWEEAIQQARTLALQGQESTIGIAINRSPCHSQCTPLLVRLITRAKEDSLIAQKVHFILAPIGIYEPSRKLTEAERASQLQHMEEKKNKIGKPVEGITEQDLEGTFYTEDVTTGNDLQTLMAAGWDMRQLMALENSATSDYGRILGEYLAHLAREAGRLHIG